MSESDENRKEYLTASQATKYLAKKWGFESYSVGAFRVLRFRYKLKPDYLTENASLWLPETLDKIPKPDRSKPRPKRGKKGTKQQHGEDLDKAA